MWGGKPDAGHCYRHVKSMWLCLSVLPLGCTMLWDLSPGGHGFLLSSQLSPHPMRQPPPNIFVHLPNLPKSEWQLLSFCLLKSSAVMSNSWKFSCTQIIMLFMALVWNHCCHCIVSQFHWQNIKLSTFLAFDSLKWSNVYLRDFITWSVYFWIIRRTTILICSPVSCKYVLIIQLLKNWRANIRDT